MLSTKSSTVIITTTGNCQRVSVRRYVIPRKLKMPFLIRLLLYNLKMSVHFTDARMRICYLWMISFWLVCTYKPIRKQFLGLVLLRDSARWIALKFGVKRTTGEVGQKEDKTCEKKSVSASGLRQFLASKWQKAKLKCPRKCRLIQSLPVYPPAGPWRLGRVDNLLVSGG